MDKKSVTLTICMGSSCFSRGNNVNTELLQRYVAEKYPDADVVIDGCLCEGKCKQGPNIKINGELYSGVTPESIPDLLDHCFKTDTP